MNFGQPKPDAEFAWWLVGEEAYLDSLGQDLPEHPEVDSLELECRGIYKGPWNKGQNPQLSFYKERYQKWLAKDERKE